jgi:hypothetical protein
MPSKEAVFKQRFAVIMAEMRALGSSPQDVYLIGGLADRLVSHAGASNWTTFKATLSSAGYDALLASLTKQGRVLEKDGKMREVHAIEVLAASLVAKTQVHDIQVLGDDGVLNGIIDKAIVVFRDSQAAPPS